MGVVVGVSFVDVRDHVRLARRLNDPDTGIVAFSAPPVHAGRGIVLRHVLRALGVPQPRGASPDPDLDCALGAAWLAALQIRDLVVVRGDWLARTALEGLLAVAAGAGVSVYLISDALPTEGPAAALRARLGETWSWDRFVGWATSRPAIPTHAATCQQALLPCLGIGEPARLVSSVERGGAGSLATYESLRHRLAGGPPTAVAARLVRRALRDLPGDAWEPGLPGIAAAMAEQGYELQAGTSHGATTWAALRRIGHPQRPAIVALVASDVRFDDMLRLRTRDVAPDGAVVGTRTRTVSVVWGGRPYLAALRRLRLAMSHSLDSPLLARDEMGLAQADVRSELALALEALGVRIRPVDLGTALTPSQRWLAERGLAVERTRAADRPGDVIEPTRRVRDPRCRHGLRNFVDVAGHALSHSQLLCRATESDETRSPAAGYVIEPVAAEPRVRLWSIRRDGQPAGHLWSVESALGRVWLQKMAGPLPVLGGVSAGVDAAQAPTGREPGGRWRHGKNPTRSA